MLIDVMSSLVGEEVGGGRLVELCFGSVVKSCILFFTGVLTVRGPLSVVYFIL